MKKSKFILILIIVLLIILNVLIVSFASLTYNMPSKNTFKSTIEKTEKTSKSIENETSDISNNTTKKKTNKITNKTTNKVSDELVKEMYYYNWTEDDKRDFTGRNCLFLYDIDGNIVDGYVTILYYGKYEREQYITNDVYNCFLEDKYSTEIVNIIKDGKVYEQ